MHWFLFLALLPSTPLVFWLSRKTSFNLAKRQPLWWLLLSGFAVTGWHFCSVALASPFFKDDFYAPHNFEDAILLVGLGIGAGNLAIASLTMFLCSISRPDDNAKN
jgi:predicted MFS family arabinose efflux permease